MDTIATIIVTAFINIMITSIISNLVFYRYQKRIESSFAEKLEETKASLAYSIFEQQTKFTTNYARRVETLDTLYKKFVAYNNALEDLVSTKTEFVETIIEENEWNQKRDNVNKLLKDFGQYYKDNRLFLPALITENISELYSEAEMVSFAFPLVLPFAERDETNTLNWRSKKTLTIPFNTGGMRYDNPVAFIDDMREKMDKQVRYLEHLYKSVAEVGDN